MGVFAVFMICWCSGLVFFPAATLAPVKAKNSEKEISEIKKNSVFGTRTIFLNDFNRKELFVLDGDFSDRQIIEHENVTYLVYFDKIEKNQIYMCAEEVNPKLNKPENSK